MFIGPGLGTKDGSTPFLMMGVKADGLRCGLCRFLLGLGTSEGNFHFPLLHLLRAFSTVSLAHGSATGSGSRGATCKGSLGPRCWIGL